MFLEQRRRGAALVVAAFALVSAAAPAQFDWAQPSVASSLPWTQIGSAGQGTGFVIQSEGYVLTNEHVIRDANRITVRISDRDYNAQVVEVLKEHDLALLKLDATGLAAVRVGDSSRLVIGDVVFAVGCPSGVCGTATGGSVANLGVTATFEDGRPIGNLIMLDLTTTHGSSGGPLLNERGEVVGLTMGGIEGSGFGFAVPIADASPLLSLCGATSLSGADRPMTLSEIREGVLPSVAYIVGDRSRPVLLPASYDPISDAFTCAALCWATENLGGLLNSGAEGVVPLATWDGPTLSFSVELPSLRGGSTRQEHRATVSYSKLEGLAVLEGESSDATDAVVRGILTNLPMVDSSQLHTFGLPKTSRAPERILLGEEDVNGVHVSEALSVQFSATGVSAFSGKEADASVQYVLIARAGNLVIWYRVSEVISFSTDTDFLYFQHSGNEILLESNGGRVSSVLNLDQFCQAARTGSIAVVDYVLAQLP